jgi:hypothetical protein
VEVLTVIISTKMFRENLECHRRWGKIDDFSGAIFNASAGTYFEVLWLT